MRLLRRFLSVVGLLVVLGGVLGLPLDSERLERDAFSTLMRSGTKALSKQLQSPLPKGVGMVMEGDGVPAAWFEVWLENAALTPDLLHAPSGHGAATLPVRWRFVREHGEMRATAQYREFIWHGSENMGGRVSLWPPVIAVLIAVLWRRVALGLFFGVWLGAVLAVKGNVAVGTLKVVTTYLWPVISDSFNLQIIAFTVLLVGMIGIVDKMGAIGALVSRLERFVRHGRSAQVGTAAMGFVVFFDDYANTVVVGSTARGLFDRMGLSRAKLAYIVDSTSAPVAAVALLSTWIGYEVGLFGALLPSIAHLSSAPSSGYGLFLAALPMRFYCFFALFLVFVVAVSGRDFGPMLRAEKDARKRWYLGEKQVVTGAVDVAEVARGGAQRKNAPWWFAMVPVWLVLATLVGGIWYVGSAQLSISVSFFSLRTWTAVFDEASDALGAILVYGAVVGVVSASVLAVGYRLLSMKEISLAFSRSMRTVVGALLILVLAWMLKGVCDDLNTGGTLVSLIGSGFDAVWLPVTVFGISALIAFCTGSSWGTMAIVLPLTGPLVATFASDVTIAVLVFGAVLDGSIWGDHCSPLSDTTVLSSAASGCDHLEHVRTQFPYACLAMLFAAVLGYLGLPLGLPLGAAYALGAVGLVVTMMLLGRRADAGGSPSTISGEQKHVGRLSRFSKVSHLVD